MKKILATAIAVLLAACSGSADSARAIAVVNGDFEQSANDGSIPGWQTVQHAGPPSYDMVIDGQGAYAGHGSFRMTRTRDQFYGTIEQDVVVAMVTDGVVELSAMMKTKDVGPKGWKLLIFGPRVREFSQALTSTGDWRRVSIRAHLPKGTSTITVGATLLDGGSGWLDDVQLRVLDR